MRITALFFLLLLLISCGSSDIAGGPGGQTTNGFSMVVVSSAEGDMELSLRPRSYRPGDSLQMDPSARVNGISRTVAASGAIELRNLCAGSYLLEVTQSDSLAYVDTFTIDETEQISRDSMQISPVGTFSGKIDAQLFAEYDSVYLYLAGVENAIAVSSDGTFSAAGLAPWNYEMVIEGFRGSTYVHDSYPAPVQERKNTDLGELDPPLFEKQYRAVKQFLTDCGITAPVESVITGDGETITALSLGAAGITAVPASFSALSFLKKLDLSDNGIVLMPTDLGTFTQLTHLSLAGNQFTLMPVSLGQCTALTTVDFSRNKLERVSEVISSLNRLDTLRVNDNAILTIPESIGNNSALELLDCSSNKLTAIPAGVTDLKAIKQVNFSYNRLDTASLSPTLVNWITTHSGSDEWIGTQTK